MTKKATPVVAKPSFLVDMRVIYPPFNSNRNYEAFLDETE